MLCHRQTPASKRPRLICQLHIRLEDIGPAVWRRLQLRSEVTLPRLHNFIQVLFNWEDCHLHEWVIGRRRWTDMSTVDSDLPDNSRDEQGIPIGQLLSAPGDSLLYRYDFGDDWRHIVLLEGILLPEPGAGYPRCVDGARNGPPEDVGGASAYEEYVDALAEPEHPRREELLAWRGPFDPEAFSLRRINAALCRLSGQRRSSEPPPAQPPAGPLVRLKLTADQRAIILEKTHAPDSITAPLRAALPSGGIVSVRIPCGDLEEIAGYVEAEARLARRERFRCALLDLASSLDAALRAHARRPPPFLVH